MDLQLARFFNSKMALVDLSDSSVEYIPLPSDVFTEHIGGMNINAMLLSEYSGTEPIVLGTGPLTGSFAPASGLMVASFVSKENAISHVPFMLNSGPQLKFSGVDFVVIIGRAEKPVMLELIDNTLRISSADNLTGTLAEREKILMSQGKVCPEIALLTGQAAESGSPHACLSIGLWGSLDKASLGASLADKNLKAITLKAAGGIAFDEATIEMGSSLAKKVRESFRKRQYVVQDKMGSGEGAKKIIKKHFKKSHACYHCPLACMSYLEYRQPKAGGRGSRRQGVFLFDHAGFAALNAKRPTDTPFMLKECIDRGLDPVAAARYLDPKMSAEKSLVRILDLAANQQDMAGSKQPEGIPAKSAVFGDGIPTIEPTGAADDFDTWEKRVSLAMALGICPIFMLCCADIVGRDLLAFVSSQEEHLEALQEKLSIQS